MKEQPIQEQMNSNVEEDNKLNDELQNEVVEENSTTEEQDTGNTVVSDEVVKLRAEAEEHQQRLLRAQADFDNFRRRTVKEKEELAKYASSVLITQLIPVIDNFERALATGGESADNSAYVKGVEMIFRQFMDVLSAEGLTPMVSVGEAFNPEYHQAIMQVESEYEEGIVAEEVQKGYILKDKVLRPAMVKVSQ